MGRAASLVGSLVRLQAPRPAVILVGRPEQSSTFAKHASLRRRADGYVQEDAPPDQLVRALETTVPSEERRGRVRWNPYVVVALGAIIVAAPALESSGLVYAARIVSGGGAALGAWAEVARRRRGEPRGLLLLVGFLIVFALNAVMLAVRVLR